jgi:hypothetical protein
MTTWLFFHWMVLTAMATLPISKEAEYSRPSKGASRACEFSHGFRLFLRPLFYQTGPRCGGAITNNGRRAPSRRRALRAHRRPERAQQKKLGGGRTPSRHLGPGDSLHAPLEKKSRLDAPYPRLTAPKFYFQADQKGPARRRTKNPKRRRTFFVRRAKGFERNALDGPLWLACSVLRDDIGERVRVGMGDRNQQASNSHFFREFRRVVVKHDFRLSAPRARDFDIRPAYLRSPTPA